jgi:hypothetical protein
MEKSLPCDRDSNDSSTEQDALWDAQQRALIIHRPVTSPIANRDHLAFHVSTTWTQAQSTQSTVTAPETPTSAISDGWHQSLSKSAYRALVTDSDLSRFTTVQKSTEYDDSAIPSGISGSRCFNGRKHRRRAFSLQTKRIIRAPTVIPFESNDPKPGKR